MLSTGQYLTQAEELGNPKAQRAALKGGLALVFHGQRHLSPQVPGQQLEKHRRARAPTQQLRPATWPGAWVDMRPGLPQAWDPSIQALPHQA